MSKHRRSENSVEATPNEQANRSLLVAGYLQQFALPSVFNRELTEEDYFLWDKILGPYPLPGIKYAFENWARNGRQFPKPANILELIGAWSVSNSDKFKACGSCDEGWVRVFEGRTYNGHPIDPKAGGVRQCACLASWIAQKKASAA